MSEVRRHVGCDEGHLFDLYRCKAVMPKAGERKLTSLCLKRVLHSQHPVVRIVITHNSMLSACYHQLQWRKHAALGVDPSNILSVPFPNSSLDPSCMSGNKSPVCFQPLCLEFFAPTFIGFRFSLPNV